MSRRARSPFLSLKNIITTFQNYFLGATLLKVTSPPRQQYLQVHSYLASVEMVVESFSPHSQKNKTRATMISMFVFDFLTKTLTQADLSPDLLTNLRSRTI